MVDRLKALRGPGEDYSDVIVTVGGRFDGAISQAAFDAIAATLPLGSVSYENALNQRRRSADRGARREADWASPSARSAYDVQGRLLDVGERERAVARHGEALRRAPPRLRVDLPRLAVL